MFELYLQLYITLNKIDKLNYILINGKSNFFLMLDAIKVFKRVN